MSETVESILQSLYSLHAFGIKPGLERTLELSEYFGNPHTKFPSIHVAGTNGKGTTCSVLAACLQSAGYSVGLYTSPHIQRFNERIKVNGVEISNEEIAMYIPPILKKAKEIAGTFFETTTILAFDYFAKKNVDIAIVETGLGGRLDSTNILKPLISVITSIDLDHQEYLGNTLEKIAFEKAGIIKLNTPVLVAESRIQLRATFEKKAQEENAQLYFLDEICTIKNIQFQKSFHSNFDLQLKENTLENLYLELAGAHAVRNAATAIVTLNCMKVTFNVDDIALRKGLSTLSSTIGFTSRIQLIQEAPTIIVDVAHNAAGIRKCLETVKNCGYEVKDFTVLFGVMADKNYDEMIEVLKEFSVSILVTAPSFDRSLPIDQLFDAIVQKGIKKVRKSNSIAQGIEMLTTEKVPFITLGSFHVIEEFLNYFQLERN